MQRENWKKIEEITREPKKEIANIDKNRTKTNIFNYVPKGNLKNQKWYDEENEIGKQ